MVCNFNCDLDRQNDRRLAGPPYRVSFANNPPVGLSVGNIYPWKASIRTGGLGTWMRNININTGR